MIAPFFVCQAENTALLKYMEYLKAILVRETSFGLTSMYCSMLEHTNAPNIFCNIVILCKNLLL